MPIGDVIMTAISPSREDRETDLAVFEGTTQPALGTRVVRAPGGAMWFGVGATFRFPTDARLVVVGHDDSEMASTSPSGARIPVYAFDIVRYADEHYRILSPLRGDKRQHG